MQYPHIHFDGFLMDLAAVVGNVKQKKNVAIDRRNRQALSDIGNLAIVSGVDGKLLSQISRPITRFDF